MKKSIISLLIGLCILMTSPAVAQNYEYLGAGYTGLNSVGGGVRYDGDWSVNISYNHRLGTFATSNHIKLDLELGFDQGFSEVATGLHFNCTVGNAGTTFGDGGFGANLGGLIWYEFRPDAHEQSIEQNRPLAAHSVSTGFGVRPGYFKNEYNVGAALNLEVLKLYWNDAAAVGTVDEGDSGGAGLQIAYANEFQVGPHFDYYKNKFHILAEAKYLVWPDKLNPADDEDYEDDGVHPTIPFSASLNLYYRQ